MKIIFIVDYCIAKSVEFGLVEIVRLVPNSQTHTPKIVKLHHFHVIMIQKNVIVTSFRKNILRKALKNRLVQLSSTNKVNTSWL
jgi:hypothetical protein